MVSKSNNNRWHSLQVEAHSITRPSDGNSDPIGVGLSKKKTEKQILVLQNLTCICFLSFCQNNIDQVTFSAIRT